MIKWFLCSLIVVSEEVNKSRECESFWAGFNRRHDLTLWGRSWSGNISAISVCIICTKRRLNAYLSKPLLFVGPPGAESWEYPNGRLLFKVWRGLPQAGASSKHGVAATTSILRQTMSNRVKLCQIVPNAAKQNPVHYSPLLISTGIFFHLLAHVFLVQCYCVDRLILISINRDF